MRMKISGGVVAFAAVLLASAAPALAQSITRGKVVDGQGKPVPDAVVVFEGQDIARRIQTKTDRNGDFLQIGLSSGSYKVTASKDGVGSQTLPAQVRQGPNEPLSFTLSKAPAASLGGGGGGGPSAADKEAAAALQASASAAVEAMRAGRHDEAIAKFNEVLQKRPECADCYYNIGVAQAQKKDYDAAEAAFKKALELKPDYGEAYTGLANIYNSQRKFDQAAAASAEAAKYAATEGGGGGSPEALYNQAVILWNAGKIAEAKKGFEDTIAAKPDHADAHYWLGMANLNEGKLPEAAASFEEYLKLAPSGQFAAQAKGVLQQIKK